MTVLYIVGGVAAWLAVCLIIAKFCGFNNTGHD